ncbi:DUF1007 family protein [Polymorphum gilvum]|uniref:Putative transporter, NiCoT family n=1 Tax=Polymorphum gilvum (strain LMG 25793 / CGMCC 1.9160 / SL003B-26A1) TaxID=991905 RepID=F2IWE7_POLGS|nr:DUF1007 family protein [Polymorphum gilvum]ADZ69246.1 Putative transporter, NiCoT family [Polymorphum gilvum SL003B-26A1]
MNSLRRTLVRGLVAAALLCVPLVPAGAHPHVFVEARTQLVFDDSGGAVAVHQVFRFDDAYTAFAIQGFDTDGDGIFSSEELADLAKVNVDSMEEYGYFTFGDNARVELDFRKPETYWLEVVEVALQDYWAMKPEDIAAIREDAARSGETAMQSVQLLELHFTLPLKEPTDASRPITLDVYDPTYYVDFRFARGEEALGLRNAPDAGCSIERREPPELDSATAAALASIGPDQRDLPPELQDAAASQVNQMIVTCAGMPGVAAQPAEMPAAAVDMPALEGGVRLRTLAGADDGAATAPGASVGMADRLFGTVARLQSEFYQKLVAALRAFRSNSDAAWLLAGLSFAYGIFHAAGPGHGKAIIASYVLASGDTLKKGVALSFVSAFAQALTAILLVGAAAVVFRLTSIAIQDTARWLEIGSYALVTALGAWLLWVKALRPMLAGATTGGHHHHHHHDHAHDQDRHHHGHGDPSHDHDHAPDGVCSSCGHIHAPTPEMLKEELTVGRAASIVLAIGLRPCSGALIVLVFALSQGMIVAGIGSTLAMALGTGITVAALATLAVGAKGAAVRFFGGDSVWAVRLHRAIEIVAAAVVFLLGATLLIATLGWG